MADYGAGDLRLVQLGKTFGDFTAVHPLDLSIPQGSFFALLGPSGCGKTTTLRMVAGLEDPTSGQILIGDTDITAKRAFQRNVNTVFQSYALFPHMSVIDNVAFGLKRKGDKEAKKKAQEALDLVELGHAGPSGPTSSREGCSSASPSPGHWSTVLTSSSSTSRSVPSTSSCAARCRSSSSASSRRSA